MTQTLRNYARRAGLRCLNYANPWGALNFPAGSLAASLWSRFLEASKILSLQQGLSVLEELGPQIWRTGNQIDLMEPGVDPEYPKALTWEQDKEQ